MSGQWKLICKVKDVPLSGARRYSVKVEDCKVYLDLEELSAPASKAEAALAGSFGVATRVMAFG